MNNVKVLRDTTYILKTKNWSSLWRGGFTSSHFLKNLAGDNVSVNGDYYQTTITDCLQSEIEVRELFVI